MRVRSNGFRYKNVMCFIVLPQLQSTYLSLGSPSHWAWRTKTLTSHLTSQLLSTHISSNCVVWWKCFWQQEIFSQGAWSVLSFNKGASRAEVCGQDGGRNTNTGGGQRWGVAWRGSFCNLDTKCVNCSINPNNPVYWLVKSFEVTLSGWTDRVYLGACYYLI